jgi:hypothetical protein
MQQACMKTLPLHSRCYHTHGHGPSSILPPINVCRFQARQAATAEDSSCSNTVGKAEQKHSLLEVAVEGFIICYAQRHPECARS